MLINNENHPIERIMDNALTKIRSFVDANIIIGAPINTVDGISIIPVSRVTMGFLTGGGEYGNASNGYEQFPFAGGSGAGVSVSPVGFLVSNGETVKFVNIDDKSAFENILDLLPKLVSSAFCSNSNCNKSNGKK